MTHGVMETAVEEPSEVAVWKRAISPESGRFDPAVARTLLELHLSPQDLDRADTLAAKARQGTLSASEDRELETFLSVSSALQFLKSKARRSLQTAAH